jgi:hypothetical protein
VKFIKKRRPGYTRHPGEVKMYQDLRRHFWWPNMKKGSFGLRCQMLGVPASSGRSKETCRVVASERACQIKAPSDRDGLCNWFSANKKTIRDRRGVDTLTKIAHCIPIPAEFSVREMTDLFML